MGRAVVFRSRRSTATGYQLSNVDPSGFPLNSSLHPSRSRGYSFICRLAGSFPTPGWLSVRWQQVWDTAEEDRFGGAP